MEWNQEIFINNIERLLADKFDGVQARLNEAVGRDAVSRWKHGERPALSILLKVTDVFGCTLNELIMEGKEVATPEQAATSPPWEMKMLIEGLVARVEAQSRTMQALFGQVDKLQEKNTAHMETVAEFRQLFLSLKQDITNINAGLDTANASALQNNESIIRLQAALLEAANKKSWEPILAGERRKVAR